MKSQLSTIQIKNKSLHWPLNPSWQVIPPPNGIAFALSFQSSAIICALIYFSVLAWQSQLYPPLATWVQPSCSDPQPRWWSQGRWDGWDILGPGWGTLARSGWVWARLLLSVDVLFGWQFGEDEQGGSSEPAETQPSACVPSGSSPSCVPCSGSWRTPYRQALVLMDDFKHPSICQMGTMAGCKQSRWFLELIKDNFLMQVIDEMTRVDALLDLLLKQGR